MTATRTRGRVQEHARRCVLDDLDAEERTLYEQIGEKVDYVDHASFSQAGTEEKLFGPGAEQVNVPDWTHFPEVPEEVGRPRSPRKALSAKNEARLFLRYNYARCRLAKLVAAQNRRRSLARARQMVFWYTRALEARADLARANMALVLAMANRTRIPNVEFSELVSEGNMALLRSVEKFDVSRGFKFSTYACRSILKGFNRLATKTGRYRQHFPIEYNPDLERSDYDVHKHDIQRADSIGALTEILDRNRARLTWVEQTIVRERFAIGPHGKAGRGRTLAEVGRIVGLTNERVRQIQKLALEKIRTVLDEEYLVA